MRFFKSSRGQRYLFLVLVTAVTSIVHTADAQLFRIVTQPGNFETQSQRCLALGYRLASIRSAEENGQVLDMLRRSQNARLAAYLGGMSDGNGNWRWTDGTEWGNYIGSNDGIRGTGETHLAYQPNDGRWHDWAQGQANLRAVCRAPDTTLSPSLSPTTAYPTRQPTAFPTAWYEHHQNNANNLNLLQDQVNGLAQSEADIRGIITSQGDTVVDILSRVQSLESQRVEADQRFNALSNQVAQTRSAIAAAVDSFSGTQDQYVPDAAGGTCVGDLCRPSIESLGNTVKISAPNGRVQIQTGGDLCQSVDPCRAEIGLISLENAMTELRGA